MKGFLPKWISWIESFIPRGIVASKANYDFKPFFRIKKGIRQGDSVSPILFKFFADMLATLINMLKAQGQVDGLIPHMIDRGLSILQYADDTVLFMNHDLQKAQNLKLSRPEKCTHFPKRSLY